MNAAAHQLRVDAGLKQLKMPGAARAWRALVREAEGQGQGYDAFLAALIEVELQNRRENRLHTHLREARFPQIKTLDSFDFTAQPSVSKPRLLSLAGGEFLRNGEAVVFCGPAGTGKTHLACALGVACIQAGHRVRFTTVTALANDLLAARDDHTLTRVLGRWRAIPLVILDELGFVPLSRDGAQVLFQFVADRYSHSRSLIVTTNLEFARWTEVFQDAHLTAALLDRLTHRCHVFEHTGESYRFRESLQLQAAQPQS